MIREKIRSIKKIMFRLIFFVFVFVQYTALISWKLFRDHHIDPRVILSTRDVLRTNCLIREFRKAPQTHTHRYVIVAERYRRLWRKLRNNCPITICHNLIMKNYFDKEMKMMMTIVSVNIHFERTTKITG